jgi:hypothetical protein
MWVRPEHLNERNKRSVCFLDGKTPGEQKSRWKDNIIIEIIEIRSHDVIWPQGTQDIGPNVCSYGFSSKASDWSEIPTFSYSTHVNKHLKTWWHINGTVSKFVTKVVA